MASFFSFFFFLQLPLSLSRVTCSPKILKSEIYIYISIFVSKKIWRSVTIFFPFFSFYRIFQLLSRRKSDKALPYSFLFSRFIAYNIYVLQLLPGRNLTKRWKLEEVETSLRHFSPFFSFYREGGARQRRMPRNFAMQMGCNWPTAVSDQFKGSFPGSAILHIRALRAWWWIGGPHTRPRNTRAACASFPPPGNFGSPLLIHSRAQLRPSNRFPASFEINHNPPAINPPADRKWKPFLSIIPPPLP